MNSQSVHLAAVATHDSLKAVLEPFDRLWLVDAVTGADLALAASSFGYSLAGSCPVPLVSPSRFVSNVFVVCNSHAAVEVHSIDTNCRVILDTQVNMLADPEPEVASLREILLP